MTIIDFTVEPEVVVAALRDAYALPDELDRNHFYDLIGEGKRVRFVDRAEDELTEMTIRVVIE